MAARRVAHRFDEVMLISGSTNASIADTCGVEEKTVRQWRTGDKRLPLAALILLPDVFVTELLSLIRAERSRKKVLP